MSTSGSANISAAHAVMSNSARRSSIKATQTTASTTSGEYPDVAPPWLSRNAAIAAMAAIAGASANQPSRFAPIQASPAPAAKIRPASVT